MEPPLDSGGSSAISAPSNEAEAVAEAEVVPEPAPAHQAAAGRVVAEQRFTGISNPGMFSRATSVLHTLYMTPELRTALYRWEGQGERDVSVAYQLQRLFCQMQLAESKTVDPRQLAVAFGASGYDTQDQFFVGLLDTLETCFGGTSVAGAISSLFDRHEEHYLRCAECGGEFCHVDTQRSVFVAVKPFGSPPIASLDEGLDGYCCAEQLNDDNQWFCKRCDRKVDAEKGLRLLSAPYILTFELQRFHFDWHADRPGIHNDRVSFPETLDIEKHLLRASKAPAVPVAGAGGEVASGGAGSQEASGVRSCNSTLGEPATSKLGPAAAGHTSYLAMLLADTLPPPVSQAWPLQAAQRRLAFAMCLRSGGGLGQVEVDVDVVREVIERVRHFRYDLYAILIHQGNGNYYAYIRDFETNQWFMFYDSHVSPLSTMEWQKAFGGDATLPAAYQLMYRRREPHVNITHVPDSDLPADLGRGA